MHFDGEPPLPLKEGWLTKVQGVPPSGTTIKKKKKKGELQRGWSFPFSFPSNQGRTGSGCH